MKSILKLSPVFAVAGVLALAACSPEKAEEAPAEEATTEAPAEEAAPAADAAAPAAPAEEKK